MVVQVRVAECLETYLRNSKIPNNDKYLDVLSFSKFRPVSSIRGKYYTILTIVSGTEKVL